MYIGSRKKLDAQLVRSSGIIFFGIYAGKLRRYFSWRNFIDPIFVIIGFLQSFILLITFWPDVIFSKGGYVSLPVTFAAFILRRPIILHESDSRMGIANRISSKFAKKVCVAFPDMGSEDKFILTGNPIRSSILNGSPEAGYKLTGFIPNSPILLVWGGSLGAEKINNLIKKEFDKLIEHFQIIHITGKDKKININNPRYSSFEYLNEELKDVYSITDFVVGRAGANSIYELALIQKPNILIPLKNADQINNAKYFKKMGASLVLKDSDNLYDKLIALSNDINLQNSMKSALSNISRPNATKDIVKLILNPNR